jgi:hypothetical protein
MPKILDATSSFLVVPATFGNCPYPDAGSSYTKGWEAEMKFYNRMKQGLEKFQANNQNLNVIYFHGLVYAGRAPGNSQHVGVSPGQSPAAGGHEQDQNSKEHEADGVILVHNSITGTYILRCAITKDITLKMFIVTFATKRMRISRFLCRIKHKMFFSQTVWLLALCIFFFYFLISSLPHVKLVFIIFFLQICMQEEQTIKTDFQTEQLALCTVVVIKTDTNLV